MRNWQVQFVGGPFDGRTEDFETVEDVPRLAIRAAFDQPPRERLASLSSFALYELNVTSSRFLYVRSLGVTESLRAI